MAAVTPPNLIKSFRDAGVCLRSIRARRFVSAHPRCARCPLLWISQVSEPVPLQTPDEDVPLDVTAEGDPGINETQDGFHDRPLYTYENTLGSSYMKTVNLKIKMDNWIPMIWMIRLYTFRNLADSLDKKKATQEYGRINRKKTETRWKLSAIATASRCISESLSDSLKMKRANWSFKRGKIKEMRTTEEPG
jgi:hypothetical protein